MRACHQPSCAPGLIASAVAYCADIEPGLTVYWVITTAHAWGLKNWRLRSITSFEDYVRRTLRMILNEILNDKGKAHLATHNLLDGRPLP